MLDASQIAGKPPAPPRSWASRAAKSVANLGAAVGRMFTATTTWRGGNQTDPAYSAGGVNCTNKDWQPSNISGDAAIAESWETLTGRVRDSVRNNPVLSKAQNMLTTLVIGSGIRSYSEAEVDQQGNYFDEFASMSDDDFEIWAEGECDASGRMALWDMMRLSFKEMSQTGLAIWLEVLDSTPGRSSPLAYQLLEYEQLDRTRDRPASRGRNRIVNGIELNKANRPVAAWIYDAHPYDSTSFSGFADGGPATNVGTGWRSTRVPASRLILNFVPDRISAHIGISWFSCVLQSTRDLDRMVANEITSRAVAALMTLFVYKSNPGTTIADALNAERTDTGKSNVKMGYPAIVELPETARAEIAQSKGGAREANVFVDLMLGQVAMGSNMSVNRLKGDPEESNLAAILSSHRDDERMVAPIQQHQTYKVVKPIRRRHEAIAAAMGRFEGVGVSARYYERNISRLQKYFVVSAGDPDIQPKDEGEAAIDRMRSGRTTPQYEIARLGIFWRKNLKQLKQWNDTLKAMGLGYADWTKGAGGTFLPFVPMEEQPGQQQQEESGNAVSSSSD